MGDTSNDWRKNLNEAGKRFLEEAEKEEPTGDGAVEVTMLRRPASSAAPDDGAKKRPRATPTK